MKYQADKAFEEAIRHKLESHEEEYNPSDWAEFEQRLDAKAKGGKFTKAALLSGAAVLIAALIFFYPFKKDEQKGQQLENKLSSEVGFTEMKPIQEASQDRNNTQTIEEKSTSQNNTSEKKISQQQPTSENISTDAQATTKELEAKDESAQQVEPDMKVESKPKKPSTYPAPKASFHADITEACEGEKIQFYIEENDVPGAYRWSFGDGQYSSKANPSHTYIKTGTYTVKLSIKSLIDDKSDAHTVPQMITVYSNPSADFYWAESSTRNHDPSITFESTGSDAIEWNWDFGDGQTSTQHNPQHIYNKKGTYTVNLTVKNTYGCNSNSQMNINVLEDYNLLAPKAFSPNGDGINDNWMPVALKYGNIQFTLMIIDKTGKVLYTTSDKDRPWDGTMPSSSRQAKFGETFGWVAKVKGEDGYEYEYGGTITVVK
ncbi:MAG: hypothetical protein COA57_13340 [Flavobacteriales bacterium]|nr:MAG: hypothetical protein COA57_13340 [Flavobacteriales bacterium]